MRIFFGSFGLLTKEPYTIQRALYNHERSIIVVGVLLIVLTGTGKRKTWKNGKAFSSQGILLKILENQEKLYWKIEKNTGKVREISQPVIVKTLQIWYHTLNKKELWKILENWKILGKSGKFVSPKKWEPCVLHRHRHHHHLCTPPPGTWLDVPHICTSNI